MLGFCEESATIICFPEDCPEDLMCTEEFRSVGIFIKDGNDQPVSLDEYYTYHTGNQKIYTFEQQYGEEGFYPVITDAQLPELNKTGSLVKFIGITAGDTITADFLIGHDCCHVLKLEGEGEIVISKY